MKYLKRKINFRKGNGEFIGFTIVSMFSLVFIIAFLGIMQITSAMNQIANANRASSRAVAISTSFEDATSQAQKVAESSITDPNIKNIRVDVSMVNANDKWETGSLVNVNVVGEVNALYSSFFKLRKRSSSFTKRNVISVENYQYNNKVSEIPSGFSTCMTYMGWHKVTSRTSNQWRLKTQSGEHYDGDGFGLVDGRYAVAMTQHYGNVGDYVDITLENGIVLHAVIADIKSSGDSNYTIYGHKHGNAISVVEFVVNKSWYNWKGSGHLRANPGTKNNHPEWGSKVVEVRNLGRNFFG